MKPVVFIHSNARQRLGALVSAHSFRRSAAQPAAFDVRLLEAEDFPMLLSADHTLIQNGRRRPWDPGDPQSFTPLRFAVPDVMGYRGLALVVDPDVFAVGDVAELFGRDREGKAIWCCARPGFTGLPDYLATSVMLLDCALLPHWRFAEDMAALWRHERDYTDWRQLRREDRSTIGLLDPVWNDFDRLTPATKLLHITNPRTQPWRTGLAERRGHRSGRLAHVRQAFRRVFPRRHLPHPDPNQQAYFYALLAEAMDAGSISADDVTREIVAGHVRADSLALADRYRGFLWPAEPGAPRIA
jgi:hypothetical protein